MNTLLMLLLVLTALPALHGGPIHTGEDAQRLVTELKDALGKARKRQINQIEQGSGKKFQPGKQLLSQQKNALSTLKNTVIPAITKKVMTKLNGKEARMQVLDWQKISKLSATELSQILKNLADAIRMLPPAAGVEAWARTLAALLSFDKEAQQKFGEALSGWLDSLLEHEDDLAQLARISALKDKADQHEQIAKLRKHYEKNFHNASQLLYPWLQIMLLLNSREPLSRLLECATSNPQELQGKFKQLIAKAQHILEKSGGGDSTESDARGFVLLALASLFAPEKFFAQLAPEATDSTGDERDED